MKPNLVGADLLGNGLQHEVRRKPAIDDIAIVAPPLPAIETTGELQHRGQLRRIGHSVQREQAEKIIFLHTDAPVLHATDLGRRRVDVPARDRGRNPS
jgi:hypothetical protein